MGNSNPVKLNKKTNSLLPLTLINREKEIIHLISPLKDNYLKNSKLSKKKMGKSRKHLFKHRIFKDNKRLQLNKKENQSKSKEA